MTTTYKIQPWKEQEREAQSPNWKIFVYNIARPWLSIWTHRYLSQNTIKLLNPTWVLPERGFPLETRRRWASRYQPLQGMTILVQGTGTGWDVISWAKLKPAKIIATDLFGFEEYWKEISLYCNEQYGVTVSFRQAALEDHSFLKSESIDLCASDAVYEHCQNLPGVMQETMRVLKGNGYVYATYGPMWFCAAGDHFGRGGLENVFNHIILEKEEYQQYFTEYRLQDENFQSGGRYIELGLFSYLTTVDYLKIFQKAGFVIDDLILEVSAQSINYSKKYPQQFNEMVNQHKSRCQRDDFLIKPNFVRLKKAGI